MRFRYLAFYKPFGVLSQFTDTSSGDRTRRTLADFIPVSSVYAAGRLDFDSEGLLLLTNDGAWQHRLTHPRFSHPRTYWAQVEGVVTAEAIGRLQAGVHIQGYRTKPCQAENIAEPLLPPRNPPIRFRKAIPTSWLQLILTEGRNRQVRRMTAAVGLPTLRLVRIAIGPVTLAGLEPGEWRELSRAEVDKLKSGVRA